MKTEKKLYRVDINLKYLVYTDKDFDLSNVIDWLKYELHDAELDEGCDISLVDSVEEIQDFDEDYNTYYTDDADEGASLKEIIDKLGLDAQKMIKRLTKLGYKVTKK